MKLFILSAAVADADALSASAAAARESGRHARGDAGANVQTRVNGAYSAKDDDGWTIRGGSGRRLTVGLGDKLGL
jgi:hypothetical protein